MPEKLTPETCEVMLPVRYQGDLYRIVRLPYCCRRKNCDCELLIDLGEFGSRYKRAVKNRVLLSEVVEYPTPQEIEEQCRQFRETWSESMRIYKSNGFYKSSETVETQEFATQVRSGYAKTFNNC
jgi:hypothetical protein